MKKIAANATLPELRIVHFRFVNQRIMRRPRIIGKRKAMPRSVAG
jgi:hypothetical protein